MNRYKESLNPRLIRPFSLKTLLQVFNRNLMLNRYFPSCDTPFEQPDIAPIVQAASFGVSGRFYVCFERRSGARCRNQHLEGA